MTNGVDCKTLVLGVKTEVVQNSQLICYSPSNAIPDFTVLYRHHCYGCAGYRVSSTHAKALGVKTDAPPEVVWDVMRAWVKKQGSESKGPPAGSYGASILAKEPSIEVDFTRSAEAASNSKLSKLIRFPQNPEANWGPKRRHTRQVALA